MSGTAFGIQLNWHASLNSNCAYVSKLEPFVKDLILSVSYDKQYQGHKTDNHEKAYPTYLLSISRFSNKPPSSTLPRCVFSIPSPSRLVFMYSLKNPTGLVFKRQTPAGGTMNPSTCSSSPSLGASHARPKYLHSSTYSV